ncbi:MAG: signal peptidase I [Clostridia bacterium]|nr:signal peptidase I [Clostridia bacterium]
MIYTTEIIKKKKSNSNKIRSVLKIIFFPFTAAILLLILYAGYMKFVKHEENINILGYRAYMVMTGSMEPNYNIGDLIIIRETSIQDLKVGDVINYVLDNKKDTVTHRISDIIVENGETLYQTKGDNNNSVDNELVHPNQIQGTLVFKISKLGSVLTNMLTGTGIVIICLLIIVSYFRSSRKEERRIAREDARKHYNTAKYEEEDII